MYGQVVVANFGVGWPHNQLPSLSLLFESYYLCEHDALLRHQIHSKAVQYNRGSAYPSYYDSKIHIDRGETATIRFLRSLEKLILYRAASSEERPMDTLICSWRLVEPVDCGANRSSGISWVCLCLFLLMKRLSLFLLCTGSNVHRHSHRAPVMVCTAVPVMVTELSS